MIETVQWAAGAALAIAAWLTPRHIAGARAAPLAVLLFDVSPVAVAWAVLLLASGRPIFAGVVVMTLGGGLALADWAKREALLEPVVFSDMSEFPQVFTHPQLYLPFAGPRLVIGSALAALAIGVLLLVLEPPVFAARPIAALAAIAVLAAGWAAGAREPALGIVAATLRRLRPTGDPLVDAQALGPFAMLGTYGVIARAERPGRRARVPAPAILSRRSNPSAPLIVVQCESFFDARRLSPLVPPDLLGGYDFCCRAGAMFGRLEVPGWGANTMRTEFAVLTGIEDGVLGYDRFNPYHAFARAPIASLPWRLRGEGYRTICLHPFDRGFFRRDIALPALGFDAFLGREAIGGSRRPPYCPDPEFARQILRTLDDEGPNTFIFAITMGNHGPWLAPSDAEGGVMPELARLAQLAQGRELLRYLDGLRQSDEMLRILAAGLAERDIGAVLAFYGDHLPSLPRAFRDLGFSDTASDYVLWTGRPGAARRYDLAADRLPEAILEALQTMPAAPPLRAASGSA
jgi:hypothetical protein